jgi:coenzyme F420-reducing hydrogenase beta subunit
LITQSESPTISKGIPKSDQSNVLSRLGSMSAPNVGLPKVADVVQYNYCCSCGTCEAVCPMNAPVVQRDIIDVSKDKGNYRKMELKTESVFQGINPLKVDTNPCVNCYACERVCPILDGFPTDEFNNVRSLKAGKSRTLKGQDGAAVSQILKSLLEQGEIDCAIGIVRNDRWSTKIAVFTNPQDVDKAAGTKYTYQPVVATMRDIHRAYIDSAETTLISHDGHMRDEERTYIEPINNVLKKYKKVALVGVPCQVHGAHLFRENFDRIELIIGLICMESFSEEVMSSEVIPKVMGVDIRDAVKMNFHKGKFVVNTTKETKEVPIKDVAPMARKGCHYCQDYTSYYADISVGSVGSDDGWSTIFVRTEKGEKLLNKVTGMDYSDKPINMEMIRKLTGTKHKNNKWEWRAFLKEIWSRDTPIRPWGRERIEKIPPPEVETVEKTEKPAKPKE